MMVFFAAYLIGMLISALLLKLVREDGWLRNIVVGMAVIFLGPLFLLMDYIRK